ncbi:FGGY family carbohydrate kinase [Amycolatopsis sp. NPDC051372]|uniref:xylulokinase n=1 Tax=Amycolatopsis sp. NPDC051372 TaxID=3155669 RepID=UPI0034476E30
MMRVLAVDVGTSEARAHVMTVDGTVLARGGHRHEMTHPGPGRAEIDPDVLVASMFAAVRQVTGHLDGVAAMCVAAELGTVFADRSGRPLGPALCWPDKRAREQAQQLREWFGRDAVFAVTGRVVDPELPAAKLLWLRENSGDAARVARVLSIKDYLVRALTGRDTTDEVHASYSMFFDVTSRTWSARMLDELRVSPDLMPEVLPASATAGTVAAAAAAASGIPAGTPVAVGGPDGSVGTVGAGLVTAGATVDLSGTADVVFHAANRPVFDPKQAAVINAHLVPGLWAIGGPTGTTGGTLARFADLLGFGADPDGLARWDEAAAAVPPGAEGLACVPAMAGERFPRWEASVRGSLFGLRMDHRSGHIARAVLEGCAYTLRAGVEVFRRLQLPVDDVVVVGGGARSPLWNEIRAAVCKLPVRTTEFGDATTLGAAVLALVCAGVQPDIPTAAASLVRTAATTTPDPQDAHRYDRLYARYERLTDTLTEAARAWDAPGSAGDETEEP